MAFRGRFRSFDFWGGVLTGALVAAFLVLVAYFYLPIAPEYSDLITNVGTVAAALVGSLFVYFTARYQMNRQREQDLAAARAVLPFTVSRYLSLCKKGVVFFSDPTASLKRWKEIIRELEIDPADLDVLKENVRCADEVARDWFGVWIARHQWILKYSEEFVREYDPHQDDTLVHIDQSRLTIHENHLIFEWSILHAIAEHLLGYARGHDDIPKDCLDPERLGYLIKSNHYDLKFSERHKEAMVNHFKKFGNGYVSKFKVADFR